MNTLNKLASYDHTKINSTKINPNIPQHTPGEKSDTVITHGTVTIEDGTAEDLEED